MSIHYNTTYYDAFELVTFQPETEVQQWRSDVIMAVIQWIIFVVGTVGNLLVLIVLMWRRPQKYKVTQLLVGALSVANIGTMTSSAWVQGLLYIDNRWPFDLIGCKVHFALQAMTPYFSMWTLATLAVDRSAHACKRTHYFMSLLCVIRNKLAQPADKCVCVCVWMWMFVCLCSFIQTILWFEWSSLVTNDGLPLTLIHAMRRLPQQSTFKRCLQQLQHRFFGSLKKHIKTHVIL